MFIALDFNMSTMLYLPRSSNGREVRMKRLSDLLGKDGNLTPEAIEFMESRHKTGPEVNRLKMEAELGRPVTIEESRHNIFQRGLALYKKHIVGE